MHPFLIEAIKAIIESRLDEAKSLLDNIINHSEDLRSNRAIAFYLCAYIAYLEKKEEKSSGYFNLIDSKYLDELLPFTFFIKTQKPSTPNITPPPPPSPKVNGAIIIKGFFSTEQITTTLSQSPISQSYIENHHVVPIIHEPIEQFKKCEDFWRFVLNQYLLQIGIPQSVKEENQASIDKVIATAKNCSIPFVFLCQNLMTLSKFWGEKSALELSKPVPPSPQTPTVGGIKFTKERATPNKPPATTSSLKSLLSTSNGSAAPSPLEGRITPVASMASSSSSPQSSSSAKKLALQNSDKLKIEAPKLAQPTATFIHPEQSNQKTIKSPAHEVTKSHFSNKHNDQTGLMHRKADMAPEMNATYIPSNALDAADDELNFFRLDDPAPSKNKSLNNHINGQTHAAQNPAVPTIPIVDPSKTTNTPYKEGQLLSNSQTAKNKEITKDKDKDKDKDKETISPTKIALAKNRTQLRRSVQNNNCLATILWFLTGIRDKNETADNNGAVSPDRTAIEIAANYGYIHCLSIMANATNDSHYLGCALRQAVIFEHDDCIKLLLAMPLNFNVLVDIYYLIKNKNNEKYNHYLEFLLTNFLNLTAALAHNHQELIIELAKGSGKETIEQKEAIIILASDLGFECCLTEYMLAGIDQLTLKIAIVNAIKNNHAPCLKILSTLAMSSKTKVTILFEILQYFVCRDKQDHPTKALALMNNHASFKLALSILSDQDKESAFLHASELANPLYLQLLLWNGNISNDTKTKALLDLCKRKNLDCSLILLNKGIARDKEKEAIQLLIQNQMTQLAKSPTTNNPINLITPHLISHAYTNHYLFALLYELKIIPKTNSLLAALVRHREIDSVNFLLAHGYDINLMHSELIGNIIKCTGTALMVAAYTGDCETIEQLLLDRGNNSSKIDLSLQLPENCHFYYQVEPTIVPNGQHSPSLLQKSSQPFKSINKLNTTFSGYSAFHFAAAHNSIACLKLLLDKLFNNSKLLNLTNCVGETALHIAAKNNRFQSVSLFMKYHPDMNICDYQQDNPLLSAIRYGHYQTVIAFAKTQIMFTHNLSSKLSFIDAEASLQKNSEVQICVIACLISTNLHWPNKIIVDELKAKEFQARLIALLMLIVDQKNEKALPMIIDCLFSSSLKWPNLLNKDSKIFCQCMEKLIDSDNVDGINLMKPYFSDFLEFSDNTDEVQADFLDLSPIFSSMYKVESFITLLKKALDPFKIRWECAKLLLLAVSSAADKSTVEEMKTDDAVRYLLNVKSLKDKFLFEQTTSTKNFKLPH